MTHIAALEVIFPGLAVTKTALVLLGLVRVVLEGVVVGLVVLVGLVLGLVLGLVGLRLKTTAVRFERATTSKEGTNLVVVLRVGWRVVVVTLGDGASVGGRCERNGGDDDGETSEHGGIESGERKEVRG